MIKEIFSRFAQGEKKKAPVNEKPVVDPSATSSEMMKRQARESFVREQLERDELANSDQSSRWEVMKSIDSDAYTKCHGIVKGLKYEKRFSEVSRKLVNVTKELYSRDPVSRKAWNGIAFSVLANQLREAKNYILAKIKVEERLSALARTNSKDLSMPGSSESASSVGGSETGIGNAKELRAAVESIQQACGQSEYLRSALEDTLSSLKRLNEAHLRNT